MREIEIKARLRDKDSTMNRLKALGCIFSEPVRQEDIVYAEKIDSLDAFLSNKVWLRIRVNNGADIIFTAKGERTTPLVATEHEVKVNSKEETQMMLSLMGYREAVRINKIRITTEYNGCEICFDEVEQLGAFIDMEKLTENGDDIKIQEELFQFFISLGINREDRVSKGYDILMLEKAGQ